jgi:hypothetical protein
MATIMLMFYLLLPPQNTPRCVLWLPAAATSADVSAACGEINLDEYSVNFRVIYNDKVLCEKPARAVLNPPAYCNLPFTLDNFKMEIFKKGTLETILCSIESPNNPPTRDEIATACNQEALDQYDAGVATLRFVSEIQPAEEPAPACVIEEPEQPASADDLATGEPYTWLAGRLLWYGLVTADCDSYSGLDPVTLAANECGLKSAADKVHHWQNQFDGEIYAAARSEGVPAKLLKDVIAVESQFWPLWENRPAGEIGLAQITPAALDTYLRYYQPGYDALPLARRADALYQTANALRCENCSLEQAVQKERENIPLYARILRAHRCASTDWRAALVLWNGEEYAKKVMQ